MTERNPDDTLALVGGTLIDGEGGAPLQNAVVLIKGDRIAEVGSKGATRLPDTAEIIDLTGQFVQPGLIDMHVHYAGWMGELFLVHGVTTIKDMGNDVEWMRTVSREVEEGTVRGPRISYVGNGLDAPPPVRDHHVALDNLEMARSAVKALHKMGASAIKVREKITPELLSEVTKEAHRLGVPVTGHIRRTDAREAALAGIDGLEHMTGIVQAIADGPRDEEPGKNELESFISELKSFSTIELSKAAELAGFLASKNVALIPTMSNFWRMGSDRRDAFAREDAEYASNESLAYVPKDVRQMWATSFVFKLKDAGDLAQMKEAYAKAQFLVSQHRKAGGRVIAGSDTFFSVPGLSLQRELVFLVDAGCTAMEAITIATRDNARFLGREAELGTIAPGKLADIMVLGANPLDDIDNIHRVTMVMKGGEMVDTAYHAGYTIPTPKPALTRPLWLERQIDCRLGGCQ